LREPNNEDSRAIRPPFRKLPSDEGGEGVQRGDRLSPVQSFFSSQDGDDGQEDVFQEDFSNPEKLGEVASSTIVSEPCASSSKAPVHASGSSLYVGRPYCASDPEKSRDARWSEKDWDSARRLSLCAISIGRRLILVVSCRVLLKGVLSKIGFR
jgi:hypothetical protein